MNNVVSFPPVKGGISENGLLDLNAVKGMFEGRNVKAGIIITLSEDEKTKELIPSYYSGMISNPILSMTMIGALEYVKSYLTHTLTE